MKDYKIEDFGKFSLDEEIEALERETRERKGWKEKEDATKKTGRSKSSKVARGRGESTSADSQRKRMECQIPLDLYRRLLFQSELEGTTVTALVTDILDRGVKTLQQLKADI